MTEHVTRVGDTGTWRTISTFTFLPNVSGAYYYMRTIFDENQMWKILQEVTTITCHASSSAFPDVKTSQPLEVCSIPYRWINCSRFFKHIQLKSFKGCLLNRWKFGSGQKLRSWWTRTWSGSTRLHLHKRKQRAIKISVYFMFMQCLYKEDIQRSTRSKQSGAFLHIKLIAREGDSFEVLCKSRAYPQVQTGTYIIATPLHPFADCLSLLPLPPFWRIHQALILTPSPKSWC